MLRAGCLVRSQLQNTKYIKTKKPTKRVPGTYAAWALPVPFRTGQKIDPAHSLRFPRSPQIYDASDEHKGHENDPRKENQGVFLEWRRDHNNPRHHHRHTDYRTFGFVADFVVFAVEFKKLHRTTPQKGTIPKFYLSTFLSLCKLIWLNSNNN